MAKPELGGKHQCQNCGTRFFDLNRTPIVCPKCGTLFQSPAMARTAQRATAAADDDEMEMPAGAELISLEDAEAGEDKVTIDADADDVEIEVADDTFLEEEEEDNDDVADLIDGDLEDDEER
ncbi:TIGR02300 family protein [Beijerinckia mobilis]|uniref:TIGR02300 family protein n=1 Tax=Beijerinckia mobilis TaxID=231434 RepID=UPI00054D2FCE|nr:TIGR02300 family protein [Beijerinckia mobilis]